MFGELSNLIRDLRAHVARGEYYEAFRVFYQIQGWLIEPRSFGATGAGDIDAVMAEWEGAEEDIMAAKPPVGAVGADPTQLDPGTWLLLLQLAGPFLKKLLERLRNRQTG